MAAPRSKLPLFNHAAQIDKDARAFHEANPQVYAKVRQLAFRVKRQGVRRFGIGALFEHLRWLSVMQSGGDKYRLNNNYRAFYARLLMDQEPTLAGFFKVRGEAFDVEYRQRPTRPLPAAAGVNQNGGAP